MHASGLPLVVQHRKASSARGVLDRAALLIRRVRRVRRVRGSARCRIRLDLPIGCPLSVVVSLVRIHDQLSAPNKCTNSAHLFIQPYRALICPGVDKRVGPLPMSRGPTREAHFAVVDQEVSALKRALLRAMRDGGGFVPVRNAGQGAVEALIAPSMPVWWERRDEPTVEPSAADAETHARDVEWWLESGWHPRRIKLGLFTPRHRAGRRADHW